MQRLLGVCGLALFLGSLPARPQVIEFESNGLKYQTLTRSGVTVMFAPMGTRLRTYAIVQVSVANGSPGPYVIRPEDFNFIRSDGISIRATPAASVVEMLSRHGGGADVLKLIQAYEGALYGIPKMRSTNGYEQRRQAALTTGSSKMRAAALASAVALVQTKLIPGQSTDGAVFFQTDGKPLGPGHLVVQTNTDTFEFKGE